MKMDICLVDYETTTAAGINLRALRSALASQTSGLRFNDLPNCPIDTWIGRVDAIESVTDLGLWQSRNNALAAVGLEQGGIKDTLGRLVQQFSAGRIGVIMGSSTSSIDRTETAYTDLHEGKLKPLFQQPLVHNPHGPALFVAHYTGITGPALTINTACSSSAKVFAMAARWLVSGIVDAVLVGGVDTLCQSVLYGFDSLQLVSGQPCKPFDQDRDGINLGEAAGYGILMRGCDLEQPATVRFSGYGESSDAYHMSHPHPDGLGARLAMEQAMTMAGLQPSAIDYINLHGTASRANDLIEGSLVSSLFPATTRCSSTKGWTGHTLGAAGITESLIAVDALSTGLLPGTMNLTSLDAALDFSITANNQSAELSHVMSNSFGFGGNNCSLVFSKVGV